MSDLVIIVYCVCLPIAIMFACYAIYYSYQLKEEQQEISSSLDEFIAAKGSQSFWIVTYSFLSSSLGAWVLFGPPSYAYLTGYVGLISYALGSGFTLLLPAYFGPMIQKLTNNQVSSLSEFIQFRYGRVTQLYITAVCLYSMSIGLIAEYTGIGDLYENVIEGNRILIVVLLGSLTSIYTAMGGLKISVKTDQIQGTFVIGIFVVFFVYVLIFADFDLSKPLPSNLGANSKGYASLFSMTISLSSSVIFSESFWQKAWIAENSQILKKASWTASFMVFVIVSTIGLYGLLAAWSFPDKIKDPNLVLFALFDKTKVKSYNGIITVIVLLATIMSESTIDSYQLGIICSISCTFMKNLPLLFTQILVLVLNIPYIILSLQNYGIVNLFLSANLITTSTLIPVLLGLSKKLRPYLKGYHVILASILGLVFSLLWGCLYLGNFVDGFNLVFYEEYRWESFSLCLFGSLIVCMTGMLIEYKFKRKKNQISYYENDSINYNDDLIQGQDSFYQK